MFGDLMTVEEVARRLKVPPSWIYRRTRLRGFDRMPHVKLGKYLRFDASVIDEWLISQGNENPSGSGPMQGRISQVQSQAGESSKRSRKR